MAGAWLDTPFLDRAALARGNNQFALDLRAARWTAVSNRAAVDLLVAVDPDDAPLVTAAAQMRIASIAFPT